MAQPNNLITAFDSAMAADLVRYARHSAALKVLVVRLAAAAPAGVRVVRVVYPGGTIGAHSSFAHRVTAWLCVDSNVPTAEAYAKFAPVVAAGALNPWVWTAAEFGYRLSGELSPHPSGGAEPRFELKLTTTLFTEGTDEVVAAPTENPAS